MLLIRLNLVSPKCFGFHALCRSASQRADTYDDEADKTLTRPKSPDVDPPAIPSHLHQQRLQKQQPQPQQQQQHHYNKQRQHQQQHHTYDVPATPYDVPSASNLSPSSTSSSTASPTQQQQQLRRRQKQGNNKVGEELVI